VEATFAHLGAASGIIGYAGFSPGAQWRGAGRRRSFRRNGGILQGHRAGGRPGPPLYSLLSHFFKACNHRRRALL